MDHNKFSMNKFSMNIVGLAILVLLQCGAAQGSTEGKVVDTSKRRIIVKFTADAVAAAAAGGSVGIAAHDDQLLGIAGLDAASGMSVLDADADDDVDEIIEEINSLPSVEYAEEDFILSIAGKKKKKGKKGSSSSQFRTNDAYYNTQWGLGQIQAEGAWQLERGSKDVKVCVIDTGVDFNHPDLKDNMLDRGTGWIMGERSDDSTDDNGHGTHVAGIVAAVGNNKIGISGVSQAAGLAGCKFLDRYGNGYMSDATKCVDWCRKDFGAKVIVASWGGATKWMTTLAEAITKFGDDGGMFVSAALNFGTNLDTRPLYPAAFNLPNQITVGGIDASGDRGKYSCYGKKTVHMFAPGTNIYSTLPADDGDDCSGGGCYGNKTGTSMAAPFVAGAAALLEAAGKCRGKSCKELLESTVAKSSSLAGESITGGILDLAAAFGMICKENTNAKSCSKWTQIGVGASSNEDRPDGLGDSGLAPSPLPEPSPSPAHPSPSPTQPSPSPAEPSPSPTRPSPSPAEPSPSPAKPSPSPAEPSPSPAKPSPSPARPSPSPLEPSPSPVEPSPSPVEPSPSPVEPSPSPEALAPSPAQQKEDEEEVLAPSPAPVVLEGLPQPNSPPVPASPQASPSRIGPLQYSSAMGWR